MTLSPCWFVVYLPAQSSCSYCCLLLACIWRIRDWDLTVCEFLHWLSCNNVPGTGNEPVESAPCLAHGEDNMIKVIWELRLIMIGRSCQTLFWVCLVSGCSTISGCDSQLNLQTEQASSNLVGGSLSRRKWISFLEQYGNPPTPLFSNWDIILFTAFIA